MMMMATKMITTMMMVMIACDDVMKVLVMQMGKGVSLKPKYSLVSVQMDLHIKQGRFTTVIC